MVDAEAQLARYVAAYNKSAKRRGLLIYADPAPVGKLSDLLDVDRLKYMTTEQCAKFRENFLRRQLDDLYELAEHGFNIQKQRINAGKKRAKQRDTLTDDGDTIRAIVESLSKSVEHKEESAKGLWCLFYAELDALQLRPVETGSKDCPVINYKPEGKPAKPIKFTSFETLVSGFRSGGKKSG
jgi:hypothetical protein